MGVEILVGSSCRLRYYSGENVNIGNKNTNWTHHELFKKAIIKVLSVRKAVLEAIIREPLVHDESGLAVERCFASVVSFSVRRKRENHFSRVSGESDTERWNLSI